MQFTPLTDEQIKEAQGILSEGYADFEIIEAKERMSKSSGNPMIEIKLKVWDASGTQGTIYDYLVMSSKMMWKLKHFCESIGRIDWYENGLIEPTQLFGKSGLCILKLDKDKSGSHPDKMKIYDYVTTKDKTISKSTKTEATSSEDFKDDDIPF